MAKASKKLLQISIEFTDFRELSIILRNIQNETQRGHIWNREKVGTGIYEYGMHILEYDMEYREEIIDGKLCIVIPSKLNKM